jgi:HEPN domain-containing protein
MDEKVHKWLRYADADMSSAEALHQVGQDLNAIFHLQQAIEKVMKALLRKQTSKDPPRIHGLRKLAQRCALTLTPEQALLLENLSEYYIESRYPGDWLEAPGDVLSREVARLISASGEFLEWLRSQI